MAEEFEESEIVFTSNNVEDGDYCLKCFADSDSEEPRRAKRKKIENKKQKTETNTKPEVVNIPANLSLFRYVKPSLFEYEYEEDGGMIPPHVMVRRRLAERMAFSVCSGIGRTLKGRDLSEMRNSVLRMTGFLET